MTRKWALLTLTLFCAAGIGLAAQNYGGTPLTNPSRRFAKGSSKVHQGREAKKTNLAVSIPKNAISTKTAGGPDSMNYRFKDSNEPGGPVFNWIEISGTGNNLNLDDDTYYYGIPFTFTFYGTTYSNIAVGSNGTVYFQDTYLGLSNTTIPSTNGYGVNIFTAVYWDDLYPSGANNIYYQVIGDKLVVEWYKVPTGSSDSLTFEAILDSTLNTITFQYLDMQDLGSSATVGIQGSASQPPLWGLQYSYDASSLANNLAILFDRYIPTSHDLTVKSIDTPATVVAPSVAFTPTATVMNPGLSPESDFRVFFQINDSLGSQVYLDSALIASPDSILPDSFRQFTFSGFTPAVYARYTAVAWTGLADDYSWNDTLSKPFRTWDLDVAAQAILNPINAANPDPDLIPSVLFHNSGTQTADFTANFEAAFGGVTMYEQQVSIIGLAGGADTTVEFPVWPGVRLEGTYQMMAYAEMAHDLNNANDTISGTFASGYSLWQTWTSLNTATAGGAHAGYEGKLYMFGGYTGSTINQISIYDTVSASWSTSSAVLSEAIDLGSAVAARGKIYVIGGEGGSYVGLDCYSPDGDSLNPRTAMPSGGLGFVTAAWRDSLIYRIGGYDATFTPMATVEIYDLVNDAWTTSPTPLPVALAYPAGTILGDTIIISTGLDAGGNPTLSTYIGIIDTTNPDSITWTTGTDYPGGPTMGSASGYIGNDTDHKLIIAGGSTSSGITGTTYTYSTDGGWELKPDKTTPFFLNAGSQVGDYFVVAGGYDGGSFYTCTEALFLGGSDKANPVVTIVDPANNGTGVHLLAPIFVSFSKPMDTTTVTYSCNPDPAGWSRTWSADLATMTLNHSAFDYSTTYALTVTAGSSLDGYAMAAGTASNPFSFTSWNPGSVIQDQMGTGIDVNLSQIFEDYPDFSSYMADDIDVAGFDSVTVSTVEIIGGYWNGHTFHPVDSLYMGFTTDSSASNLPAWSQTVWAGNISLAGYDEIGLGTSPSKFVMYLDPPVTLAPGKNWMIWAPYMNYEAKDGQCGWVPNPTITGVECSWRNPGGGLSGNTEWIHTSAMFSSAADAYMRIYGQTFTGVEGNPGETLTPIVYSLSASYPNPSRDNSTIKFALPQAGQVKIEIYNIAGQRVKTLVNGSLGAGYHQITWNGRNEAGQKVANGVYMYRMNSGSFTATKKLLMVK